MNLLRRVAFSCLKNDITLYQNQKTGLLVSKALLSGNDFGNTESVVAIKEIDSTRAAREAQPAAALERLTSEAVLLARVNHPNILHFHGVYDAGNTPRMIYAFCDLGTLKQHFRSSSPSTQGAMAVLTDVAAGMQYLHTLDPPILHRDIKADNVFLSSALAQQDQMKVQTAILGDFDRAVELPDGKTVVGAVGSLTHMPPDMLLGEVYGLATDSYAFGMLAYEVLAGRAPHAGVLGSGLPGTLSPKEFIKEVVKGLRPSLSPEVFAPKLDDSVRTELQVLLEACWAHQPADRPTAEEILASVRKSEHDLH